jgi:hypothetical protein
MTARRKAGLPVLTPGEYLSVESSYRQRFLKMLNFLQVFMTNLMILVNLLVQILRPLNFKNV